MNIYKEKKTIELDTSVFEYGALYTISKDISETFGYKLLVCCSDVQRTHVHFIIIENITGCYFDNGYHLNVDDDPDPDLEIYRVCLDRDSRDQRVYLREEKTDYRALAEKLYNQLEGVAADDCEA